MRKYRNVQITEICSDLSERLWPRAGAALVLFKMVYELNLSVRSSNCLINANIVYIEDLVQKSEAEMLRVLNLGQISLNEIKVALAKVGLRLGMDVAGWHRPLNRMETNK